ncbi:hypothetical protein A176_002279 [Myxococcus hansupus]|uniref:Uncharacterized protein n=1 Tax=Pseudomyxococcus hansupus TaxID=1297742 RepID=A0A0H4XBP5_9BACT|nr:hypothetical protein A176_002279 [Myxococcus hansupus]
MAHADHGVLLHAHVHHAAQETGGPAGHGDNWHQPSNHPRPFHPGGHRAAPVFAAIVQLGISCNVHETAPGSSGLSIPACSRTQRGASRKTPPGMTCEGAPPTRIPSSATGPPA